MSWLARCQSVELNRKSATVITEVGCAESFVEITFCFVVARYHLEYKSAGKLSEMVLAY